MASRIPCVVSEVARPIGDPDTHEDHIFLQSQPDVQGRTTSGQACKRARTRSAATERVEQGRPRITRRRSTRRPGCHRQPSRLGPVAPSGGRGARPTRRYACTPRPVDQGTDASDQSLSLSLPLAGGLADETFGDGKWGCLHVSRARRSSRLCASALAKIALTWSLTVICVMPRSRPIRLYE